MNNLVSPKAITLEQGMSMMILGIETSCDETAAAVIDENGRIISDVIASQVDEHRHHGGVVPEIAARAHLRHLDDVITEALADAGCGIRDLGAVAATGGPGLIGGVLVGTVTAKAIASALDIPYYAINHLEGHALTARLTDQVSFPFLLLLVSGGHTQLLSVTEVGQYRHYGGTIDDAAGEAFDKSARLLGLPVPGGAEIEKLATKGNPSSVDLPRPLCRKPGCDFSFSGLKTALMTAWHNSDKSETAKHDLAASLQAAVTDCLVAKSDHAMQRFLSEHRMDQADFVVSGGVAANRLIREKLERLAGQRGFSFHAPPPRLCTDNAVMIAWAAAERMRRGLAADTLDFAPRPRWPLESLGLAS